MIAERRGIKKEVGEQEEHGEEKNPTKGRHRGARVDRTERKVLVTMGLKVDTGWGLGGVFHQPQLHQRMVFPSSHHLLGVSRGKDQLWTSAPRGILPSRKMRDGEGDK